MRFVCGMKKKPLPWSEYHGRGYMAIYGLLVRDPILAELAAECLIDQHVHGLRDAHHCGERHSPCRVVEASGSADGDDAEDDG